MAKHFDDNGNEMRCVYLAEFDADNCCYVGTANDYDERIEQHLFKDRRSEVFQHKRHTGFLPKFTMLHDYTSIEESDKLELFYTIEYAKRGWKILNVQTPGGYGHKENSTVSPVKIKGKINEYVDPYNAMAEYDKFAGHTYCYKHKGEYSDSVKKVYDILIEICNHVCEEGGERICIREIDIPYAFSYDELNSYNLHARTRSGDQLCVLSYFQYFGKNQDLSYLECSNIDKNYHNSTTLCQYEDNEQFGKICNDIYKKCYVFKRTEKIKEYYHNNLEIIDDAVSRYLLNREITTPFSTRVSLEQFGYCKDMECRKIDYAAMLSLSSHYFTVDFDKNWNLSSINLSVSYNSYSIWAKRYDAYEMQDENKQYRFRKLVEKIDNYIYSEKGKITVFPKRIEILAKDLRITDIETLKSFMRHFYVCHGTAWDTGSPDSCICSIENYNGNNMNGCKFIIDIQGEQFFVFYDLKNHVLDDSNSIIKH